MPIDEMVAAMLSDVTATLVSRRKGGQMNPNSSVKVRLVCKRDHDPHELCVEVRRGAPPELRCESGQPSGISRGGSGGCPIPSDFQELVESELRDSLEESKRQGYVLVHLR